MCVRACVFDSTAVIFPVQDRHVRYFACWRILGVDRKRCARHCDTEGEGFIIQGLKSKHHGVAIKALHVCIINEM